MLLKMGKSYSQREDAVICHGWAGCPLGYVLIWLMLPKPEGCRMKRSIFPWETWFWADKERHVFFFPSPVCWGTSVRNALSSSSPHTVNHCNNLPCKSSPILTFFYKFTVFLTFIIFFIIWRVSKGTGSVGMWSSISKLSLLCWFKHWSPGG